MEKSEILEPVHNTVRELIELEVKGTGWSGSYTDNDVVAVTLLYSMVLGKRLVDQLKQEKVGLEMSQDLSDHFAALIQETSKGMSKVSVKDFYNKRSS